MALSEVVISQYYLSQYLKCGAEVANACLVSALSICFYPVRHGKMILDLLTISLPAHRTHICVLLLLFSSVSHRHERELISPANRDSRPHIVHFSYRSFCTLIFNVGRASPTPMIRLTNFADRQLRDERQFVPPSPQQHGQHVVSGIERQRAWRPHQMSVSR